MLNKYARQLIKIYIDKLKETYEMLNNDIDVFFNSEWNDADYSNVLLSISNSYFKFMKEETKHLKELLEKE